MRTIHRYVTVQFLSAFVVTLCVLSFVMCIGMIFGASKMLARGISLQVVLRLTTYGIPEILAFSIPVSLLTTSLLLFGRLSADAEITAMKANGMSLWRVVSPLLLLAVGTMVLCFQINNVWAPKNHFSYRKLVKELGMESTSELLPEGQPIRDFPGMTLWIERKEDDQLFNIRIYDSRLQDVRREVRAKRGAVRLDAEGQDLVLDLFDVTIDPFDDKRPGAAVVKKWTVRIADVHGSREYRKREQDLLLSELLDRRRRAYDIFADMSPGDIEKERTALAVEMNKRMVLACSSFAFVLLGISLGITTHRRESSVGVGMSLFVVFNFYLFIVFAESLAKRPPFHPEFLIWLPVTLAVSLGLILLHRNH